MREQSGAEVTGNVGIARWLGRLIFAACGLVLGGCGGQTAVEKATEQGILLLGNGPEPVALDPQITTGTAELNIHMALFEGLTAPDPKTLEPVPGVAERWDVSDDGRVYVFHLRKEAAWSDGKPVRAADFAYAFRRILTPELGAGNASLLFDIEGAAAFNRGESESFDSVGVEVVDEHTLRIRLRHAVPYFLSLLSHPAFYPVRSDVIEAGGSAVDRGNRWDTPERLVGNGPFRLVEWRRNEWVAVERNPHYWDAETVALNGIRFHTYTDPGTEERAFLSGQLHATDRIAPGRVPWFTTEYPEWLRLDPYLGTYYYLLNHEHRPLGDARVRQALSLAIDREAITSNILRAGQTAALSFTPENMPGYAPPRLPEFDPQRARTLLAQAGFPGGIGFPQLNLLFNTSESHRIVAEAIQDMWRTELGIQVQLTNQEVGVYYASRESGDFDIARAVWIGDYLAPETFLHLWTSGSSNNFSRWASERYDALVAAASQASDPTERMKKLRQAETLLLEEQVVLPIYHYVTAYLLRSEVKGWHPTLLDWHPYKALRLEGQ